jgi:Big-like domain-containing protein
MQFAAIALGIVQPDLLAAAELSGRSPPVSAVRWTPDPTDTNKIVVEVAGLSTAALEQLQQSDWKLAQWQRLLPVYAGQGDLTADIGLPPMIGAYQIESAVLRFKPQFPLQRGIKYRAIFHSDQLPGERSSGGGLVAADFEVPSRQLNPTTVVSRVYPSGDVLPENLLKFYVHFSAPMSRGRIYDHIHLRDDTGKDIELPFLEIDEELWNPAMTRLTLFIDPGRIKRGVRPLEEIGPALEEGKRYTLVIDHAWRDGIGNSLKETFQKTFKVGPPDRQPPDPAGWRIQSPKSETREALAIAFPEPMDHALAERVIRVTSDAGEIVEGKSALRDQERRWTFVPTRPWGRGAYRLVVQTTIEDLAGNNIGKPFEVDLFEGVQRRLSNTTVKLPFEVR